MYVASCNFRDGSWPQGYVPFAHKLSARWVLTEQNQRLPRERRIHVTQAKQAVYSHSPNEEKLPRKATMFYVMYYLAHSSPNRSVSGVSNWRDSHGFLSLFEKLNIVREPRANCAPATESFYSLYRYSDLLPKESSWTAINNRFVRFRSNLHVSLWKIQVFLYRSTIRSTVWRAGVSEIHGVSVPPCLSLCNRLRSHCSTHLRHIRSNNSFSNHTCPQSTRVQKWIMDCNLISFILLFFIVIDRIEFCCNTGIEMMMRFNMVESIEIPIALL